MTGREFIERVDVLLKKRNETRKLLTTDLGIASSTMANWSTQNTTPNANIVEQIANYFNVSTDWLIKGEEFNNEVPEEDKILLEKYNKLSEENKKIVLSLIENLGK